MEAKAVIKLVDDMKKEIKKLKHEIIDIKNQLIVANTTVENLKVQLHGDGTKNYVNHKIWH